jgi:glycosyltransferase involved in cell wall biosynthesis
MIVPHLGSGGAQKVFKDQFDFYSKHFETTACIFNWDGASVSEKKLPMVSLDVPGGNNLFTKFFFFCRRIVRLRNLKHQLKIDVSISHLEGADYVNILSQRQDKTICYIHGSKFHDHEIVGFIGWVRQKVFMTYLYRRADLVIPVSLGLQDEMISNFEIPQTKIQVINNGFDIPEIERKARQPVAKELQELLTGFPTLCMCSRLAPPKNQEIFFVIFARLLQRVSCKLIILGDGDLRNKLIAAASDLGLRVYSVWKPGTLSDAYDVYFVGNKDNPFSYMAKSSVFVLPSAWEGFPLALCEAMICGVPVVASDCPTGPREILTDAVNKAACGFLLPVPGKDNNSALDLWIETLALLLSDKRVATTYAEKAKFRAKDFSSEKAEAAWLQSVGKLIT